MAEKKLYLLDAFALIYRAHFAFARNPRINSKGLNTSAILGFMNAMLEIINKENQHILLSFLILLEIQLEMIISLNIKHTEKKCPKIFERQFHIY